MKIFNVLAIVAILSTGVVHASEPVRVARSITEVETCRVVGPVSVTGPYFLPGADVRRMAAQVQALQADTLFVTDRGLISHGIAYRCDR